MKEYKKEKVNLFLIKAVHTIIWAFFVVLIMYILYSSIKDKINILTFIAIIIIAIEGLVLFMNRWRCPLTSRAEKFAKDRETGFDIFLPKWLAKNNKAIFTLLYIIGVAVVAYRLLT